MTGTLKAMIVDDEKAARESICQLLKKYCPDVEIKQEASNISDAFKIIMSDEIHILFLDIQMPEGSGFELLEKIDNKSLCVIFTTAYDQYAIKAIKYSALDYLLKPIDPEELVKSVNRCKKEMESMVDEKKIKVLLENLKTQTEDKKVVFATIEGLHIEKMNDIIHCQSDTYYTNIFFVNKKKLMVSKTLKEVEEMLDKEVFIRPHKSHLLNVNHVRSYLREDSGYILLSDQTKIPVSRRKKEQILKLLQNL